MRFPLLAFVLVLFLYPRVFAQGDTGQLSGSVFDINQAAVLGASVKLVNESTSQTREVVTNDSGGFVFSLLPRGVYKL